MSKLTQVLDRFTMSGKPSKSPESRRHSVLSIVNRVFEITGHNQAFTLRFWDATLRTDRSYQEVIRSFELDPADSHAQRRVSQHFLPSRLYDVKRPEASQTVGATTPEVNILKGDLVSVASNKDLNSELGMMLIRHSLNVLTAYEEDENMRRQVLNQIRSSWCEFGKSPSWPETLEDIAWMDDVKRPLRDMLSKALGVTGDPGPLRVQLSDSQIRQAEDEQWTVPCMAPWLVACLSKLDEDATTKSGEHPVIIVGSRAAFAQIIRSPSSYTARAFPA